MGETRELKGKKSCCSCRVDNRACTHFGKRWMVPAYLSTVRFRQDKCGRGQGKVWSGAVVRRGAVVGDDAMFL